MIEIRNWPQFQHYKNRRPPWIKLHDSLLDSVQWSELGGDSAKLLIELWLTAGRDSVDGKIELASKELAWRLRRSVKSIDGSLKELEQQGFISLASNALAECKQLAMPETETETEGETKTETEVCDFASRWNRLANDAGLATIKCVTSGRMKHLKARMKEHSDFWDVLEREIPMLSDFARGVDGKSTWKLAFDFCLSPDNFVKLSEGKYRGIKKLTYDPTNGYSRAELEAFKRNGVEPL
jgi:hypothetical protein